MGFANLFSVALSDVGKKRKSNQDAVLALPENGIFCVADGMGGMHSGDVASSCIVDFLRDAAGRSGSPAECDFEQVVLSALKQANGYLLDFTSKNKISGTGSTAVVLAFDPVDSGKAVVFHAGDSRAYRVRAGKIEQLTRDHSMMEALNVRSHELVPAFFRGLITKAIGLDPEPDPERSVVDVEKDDLYILCSDGLTRMVPDDEILNIVNTLNAKDLCQVAKALVDLANESGGDDNIAVVLVLVGENGGK